MLVSSDRISSWTPLKPQHSNPNPNPSANQLWSIDFLTPPIPLIIPHRLTGFLESLMHSKTEARFMQDGWKAVWSIPYVSVAFFPSLKQNFIAYRSSKVSSRPDYIFEIHSLWQSGFSRVYSNCCCSCSFKPEIIKLGQSCHYMCSNNLLNFQESLTILNVPTKNSGNLLNALRISYIFIRYISYFFVYMTWIYMYDIYIYIYTYIYIYIYIYTHTISIFIYTIIYIIV